MEPYYTVVIPYVNPIFRTEWHPTGETGPLSTRTSGCFHTPEEAIRWARANLAGTPYSIRKIDPDAVPSRDRLRDLAEIEVQCEPETEPYVGNCSAIDPETDREQEEWIRSQLARGNDWAWCAILVTATHAGLTGHAGLGCCSLENERGFIDCYRDELITEALDDLRLQLEQRAAREGCTCTR